MSEADTPTRTKKTAPLDVAGMLNQAREQFTAERDKVLAERKQFDDRLAEIDAELAKIEAYFNPPAPAVVEPKPPRQKRVSTGPRKPREGGKRERVLAEIAKHPEGISRTDLNVVLGANDAKGKQSVSNTVSALRRDGMLDKNTPTGIYKAA